MLKLNICYLKYILPILLGIIIGMSIENFRTIFSEEFLNSMLENQDKDAKFNYARKKILIGIIGSNSEKFDYLRSQLDQDQEDLFFSLMKI